MQFRRRLSRNANVDLIPMIDVVFQLVVFFMVSSTFIMTPGINLDLPGSSSSEPVVVTRTIVSVVSADEVYLNRERFTLQELDLALRSASAPDTRGELAPGEEPATRSVVIEADRSVSYELMVQVLDVLRRNGYRGVNLRTREEMR
ncbi:MAG: biopolymer transporter ExbD [Spirochaetaceae bacterium]|nr:MAG: biopolymer transporter ExbD [Spirochaetaceae bacterium]